MNAQRKTADATSEEPDALPFREIDGYIIENTFVLSNFLQIYSAVYKYLDCGALV